MGRDGNVVSRKKKNQTKAARAARADIQVHNTGPLPVEIQPVLPEVLEERQPISPIRFEPVSPSKKR